MTESDPIEQRIAAGACGHCWLREEFNGCPVCAMMQGTAIRISDLEAALHNRDEGLADSSNKLFELTAALRKAKQERDALALAADPLHGPQRSCDDLTKTVEYIRTSRDQLKQERDEARRALQSLMMYHGGEWWIKQNPHPSDLDRAGKIIDAAMSAHKAGEKE